MTARTPTASRARRLLALLPYLTQGATIPLTKLAENVSSTVPEVIRDLTTLTMCGVPPFTPDEMIDLAIDEEYVTVYAAPPALDRPLRLSPREARALVAALEATGHGSDDPLVAKLLDAASSGFDLDDFVATLRAGEKGVGIAGIYATLAEAIDSHKKVRIAYFTASRGSHSTRVIQPHSLVNERGVWYVNALCENAEGPRTFRLDRIRDAVLTTESFDAPPEASTEILPATAGLPVATLRLAPGAPHTEERDWPGATFTIKPNGAVFADVPYVSASWVARRVAAGLGMIDAISTDEVRAAVRQVAEAELRELPRSPAQA
ncbi:MAG: WYL domain-containing protein [Coriobacteriales bacterium]|nr:WYL domain-containing protein [Actinomycetes bacterium]